MAVWIIACGLWSKQSFIITHWMQERDESLMTSLKSLAPDELTANVKIDVNDRVMQCRYEADDIAWFDFSELCDGPRSQNDYIELAGYLSCCHCQ